MSRIDWSKAGKRIRHQPRRDGANPDWHFSGQRWKDEADYWADDLTDVEVITAAGCPMCHAPAGDLCVGPDIHMPRRRAAGEATLAVRGPRFTRP